jgi:hypothetical protein
MEINNPIAKKTTKAVTKSVTKRIGIEKANKTIVILTGVAAFISVFSLVSTKALYAQLSYQNKVISAKKVVKTALDTDVTNFNGLESSYAALNNQPQNVLGGNPNGTALNDGTNGRIILDALPQEYDYPALVTSLAKLITLPGGQTVTSISATDVGPATTTPAVSSTTGTASTSTSSLAATPVPIPVSVEAEGSYSGITQLINLFQSSTRPYQVQNFTLDLSNGINAINYTATMQTYYQPSVTFTLGSKIVK